MNELTPLSILKKRLDVLIGEGWQFYEIETLLLSLEKEDSPLLRDKLNLLKVITVKPEIFYEDILFFMHSVSVMNNKSTSFEHVPHVTSLEMAFAIEDMAAVSNTSSDQTHPFNKELRLGISYILREEGYSEVVYPFTNVGITGLVKGQTESDTQNKEKAIKLYVYSMYHKPAY